MKLNQFKDADTLNKQFSREIVAILTEAINLRGHAYMAVPGGKTPLSLFSMLSKMDIDWAKVTITLTDERRVKPISSESNEYLVQTYLLQDFASKANFISLYSGEKCSKINIAIIQSRLASIPAFDVVILGMGEDGHTASLFPCSRQIHTGLADNFNEQVLAITPKNAPYKRVTLTKTRLLNSKTIFLYIVGKSKWHVLQRALKKNDSLMPIRVFLNTETPNVNVMFAP